MLLAHILGYSERTRLYLHLDRALSAQELAGFENLVQRREQREPVAYLTGHKEFFALDFEVNPHVLIPRPETELLVETALKIRDLRLEIGNQRLSNLQSHRDASQSLISIIDVGTGSGCIAIALAKHLSAATIFASDLSPEAVQLARRNAERHGVAATITFWQGDLLEPLPGRVDMIVSNPPYVSQPELRAAQPEVSRYEPRLALDGGPDGLTVIRRLLVQAGKKLNPGGAVLVEIGSGQGEAAQRLAYEYFPTAKIKIKPDLAHLDRLLVIEI